MRIPAWRQLGGCRELEKGPIQTKLNVPAVFAIEVLNAVHAILMRNRWTERRPTQISPALLGMAKKLARVGARAGEMAHCET